MGKRGMFRYLDEAGLRAARASFEAALEAGLNVVDTSELHGMGQAERMLGRLLRQTTQRPFVASKLAPTPFVAGPLQPTSRLDTDSLCSAIDGSLERLGLDHLDLYQVPVPGGIPGKVLMDGLAEAVNSGRVAQVGVINYNARQLRWAHAELAARGIALASNQVEYSLLHRNPEHNGVLDCCNELGISMIACNPLHGGLLDQPPTGRDISFTPPGRVLSPRKQHPAMLLRDGLARLAREHGTGPGQVALAWVLARPGVLAIHGARDAQSVREAASSLKLRLGEAVRRRLGRLCTPRKHVEPGTPGSDRNRTTSRWNRNSGGGRVTATAVQDAPASDGRTPRASQASAMQDSPATLAEGGACRGEHLRTGPPPGSRTSQRVATRSS